MHILKGLKGWNASKLRAPSKGIQEKICPKTLLNQMSRFMTKCGSNVQHYVSVEEQDILKILMMMSVWHGQHTILITCPAPKSHSKRTDKQETSTQREKITSQLMQKPLWQTTFCKQVTKLRTSRNKTRNPNLVYIFIF